MILKEMRHQIGDLPLDNPEELDFSAPGASFEEEKSASEIENDLFLQVRKLEKEDAREVTEAEVVKHVIDNMAIMDMTKELVALNQLGYSDLIRGYVSQKVRQKKFDEESDEFKTLLALGIGDFK
jgi:hypothetical protein